MTKYEYLAKLEQLLAAMPQQERREASYGGYTPASGTTAYRETDSIRKAMGLK